jgi:MerR family transcriptional regulator/heat shock protein HspR
MTQRHVGVFAISVAAEMVSTQVQNLRVYERHGLVAPTRTPGGTRLYSHDDIEKLTRVRDLLDEGLNVAGITRVLALEAEVARLRSANRRLRQRVRET